MQPDKQKVEELAGKIFLELCSDATEGEAFAAVIQAACMYAAFRSSSFDELQSKMAAAARFAGSYIEINRELYEAHLQEKRSD